MILSLWDTWVSVVVLTKPVLLWGWAGGYSSFSLWTWLGKERGLDRKHVVTPMGLFSETLRRDCCVLTSQQWLGDLRGDDQGILSLKTWDCPLVMAVMIRSREAVLGEKSFSGESQWRTAQRTWTGLWLQAVDLRQRGRGKGPVCTCRSWAGAISSVAGWARYLVLSWSPFGDYR